MSIRTYTRSYYARVEQTYQIETDSLSAEDLEALDALDALDADDGFDAADGVLVGFGILSEDSYNPIDDDWELDIQRIDNEEN